MWSNLSLQFQFRRRDGKTKNGRDLISELGARDEEGGINYLPSSLTVLGFHASPSQIFCSSYFPTMTFFIPSLILKLPIWNISSNVRQTLLSVERFPYQLFTPSTAIKSFCHFPDAFMYSTSKVEEIFWDQLVQVSCFK